MDSQKLSKVVSILYDMELNDYYMTKSIKDLDVKINSLGLYNYYKEPVKARVSLWDYLLTFGGGGFLVGCAFAFFSIWDFFDWSTFLSTAFLRIVIGTILGVVVSFCVFAAKRNTIKKEFNREVSMFNYYVNLDRDRVSRELYEQKILTDKRMLLENQKQNSLLKLQQFKNMSGIDKKFCNIVALGYMNEFINLGISTKLEGADGLYYLILQELRWDQMMLTMEEISAKLDEVIDNQRMLHMDLVEMNQKSSKMIGELMNGVQNLNANVNELKSIEQYNGTRIRQELEFQNFMLICNS